MSVTPKVGSRCSSPSPSPRRTRPRAASAGSIRESRRDRASIELSTIPSSAAGVTGNYDTNREPADLPKRRRVKLASADNRVSAGVNVNHNGPWSNKEWGQTSYSSHFTPKKLVVTSKPRPASATRMNNPHPSKMFLQWRVPTRIHPHSRSMPVNPSFLRDIQEQFYQDYSSDQNNTGKAMYEVPITNVAQIPFPGLEVTGNKLSLGNKPPASNTTVPVTSHHLKLYPAAAQRTHAQILQRTLQPSSYAAYQEWAGLASDKERAILEKMVKSASIEDSKTKKMLSEVFTKDSIKHIKNWMHGADEEELALAMMVINQLSQWSQSRDSKNPNSPIKTHHSHQHSKAAGSLYRSRSWPKQPTKPSTINIPNEFGIHGKKLRPHSADLCSNCSDATLGSIYKALKSNKLNFSQSLPKQEPTLWNHKIKPPIAPKLLNRGAVFNLPQKKRGQHFTLHPEWPTA